MKRLLGLVSALAFLVAFFLPSTSFAQGAFDGCLNPNGTVKAEFAESPLCKDLSTSQRQNTSNNSLYGPGGIVTNIANLLSLVVGVAAVIMIIIGGVRYVLSSGDSQNLEGAKNTILFALIGLGVAIFAQLIVVFVVRRL